MKEIKLNDLLLEIELNKVNPNNVIDVRQQLEYDEFNVAMFKNYDINQLVTNPENFINKNETYYILCAHGVRSLKVSQMLESNGYDVCNIIEGIHILQNEID